MAVVAEVLVTGELLRFAMDIMRGLGWFLLPIFVVLVPFSLARRALM